MRGTSTKIVVVSVYERLGRLLVEQYACGHLPMSLISAALTLEFSPLNSITAPTYSSRSTSLLIIYRAVQYYSCLQFMTVGEKINNKLLIHPLTKLISHSFLNGFSR
jgi:hypothetical protein